jgi:hypothetical protein
MSFAVNVMCGDDDAQHRVVVDLQRQLIVAPSHTPEHLQRYGWIYELGGEPPPCCMVAIWWRDFLFPSYLHLKHQEDEPEIVSAVLLRLLHEVYSTADAVYWIPVIVMPGFKPPVVIGRAGFHIGGKGQIIKSVSAYRAKGGKTKYHEGTERIVVGEDWLILNGLATRPTEDLLPPEEPDPEWLETTHEHTHEQSHHDRTSKDH